MSLIIFLRYYQHAEKVTLTSSGVFVACDNAGAAYIPIENFGTANPANSFGTDFTVDHVAVHNNIAEKEKLLYLFF